MLLDHLSVARDYSLLYPWYWKQVGIDFFIVSFLGVAIQVCLKCIFLLLMSFRIILMCEI